MEILGRILSIAFWMAFVVGWILILLPGVVRRLRRDPKPRFPPVPLAQPMGPDGAVNASTFCNAITAGIAGSVLSEESSEISVAASHGSVVVTWDQHGITTIPGAFFVDLPQFPDSSYFELSIDDDVTDVFWIAVGYLREGSVHCRGHDWIHVEEAGMWFRASASTRTVDVEPEWATRLPG